MLVDVAIIGRSCRLPGAASVSELWKLMSSGRCAISQIPQDRWNQARWSHPTPGERGKSYTWAAGVLENIWEFDPTPFGLSPREAEQMDPQQRLLLELAWEALEDAGISPSSMAGSPTGVFVGASSLDYGNLRLHDVSSGDAYFATGNTLSIIANRLSYAFDLTGPSFTIDTACSSSLVALHEAVQAIRSGRIDTAIVAGVNILASPFGFISFSQAGMLSPTGLCHAFSDRADGYVRAEGGVVLVLRSGASAERMKNRSHAQIAGSGINSDGRTNGIALPAKERQAALLHSIYSGLVCDPDEIAFVEAHGTGTRVGDPTEAIAIGEVLGAGRTTPLLIGSIKTNIGHTEPVSGLAGVMKAMLALENDALPASLHCETPNPDIPFSALNLLVCDQLTPLSRDSGRRFAGISSFGFGGTNAHVVVTDAPRSIAAAAQERPRYLMVSAQTREALHDLLAEHAEAFSRTGDGAQTALLAAAANFQRERLNHRAVVPVGSGEDIPGALSSLAEQMAAGRGTIGAAVARSAPVAFVFSGNGSQWPGMGRKAYAASHSFRSMFETVSGEFEALAGWSLTQKMHDPELAEQLHKTSIAQPLIFAIQIASVHALNDQGLKPSLVLGHSVGEIAAAHVSGALSLAEAVRTIHFRSHHQELTRDTGGMAVVFGSREATEALVRETNGLELAGCNSSRAFVVSGSPDALATLGARARNYDCRTRSLDLPYPFHSRLMALVEKPLATDLAILAPSDTTTTFISTVTGGELPGRALGCDYWWRNVREPIRFMEAAQEAMRLGARVFVEIGPSKTLLSHIADSADGSGVRVAALGVLDRKEDDGDPFCHATALAIAHGAEVVDAVAFGKDPGWVGDLPPYSWIRRDFRLAASTEATGLLSPGGWHPLVGCRSSEDDREWRGQIDCAMLPMLLDHRLDGHVVLPGAAFLEMALAVARDWTGSQSARILEFEILQPMQVPEGGSREIRSRVSASTGTIEIMSRLRLTDAAWQTHALAKIASEVPGNGSLAPVRPRILRNRVDAEVVYEAARRLRLAFGPSFRQLRFACRLDARRIWVDLEDSGGDFRFGLDPSRLDACFHGLILMFAQGAAEEKNTASGGIPGGQIAGGHGAAYVPVRIAESRLFSTGNPTQALITVVRQNERVIVANFSILGDDGRLLASLQGVRFRAVQSRPVADLASISTVQTTVLGDVPGLGPKIAIDLITSLMQALEKAPDAPLGDDEILLEGWATAAAFRLASALAVDDRLDVSHVFDARLLPEPQRAWFANLLLLLERAGLARPVEGGWSLEAGTNLPDPDDIIATVAAEHPQRSAELVLAARTSGMVRGFLARVPSLSREPVKGPASDAHDSNAHNSNARDLNPREIDLHAINSNDSDFPGFGGVLALALARATIEVALQVLGAWPGERAMRILQLGHGPLSTPLARLSKERQARLTILEPNSRRLERCRISIGSSGTVDLADSLSSLGEGQFDLVVSAGLLHRLTPNAIRLEELQQIVAPGGVLASLEPQPSSFADLVYGFAPEWFSRSAHPEFPVGALRSSADWRAELEAAGFEGAVAETVRAGDHSAILVAGRRGYAQNRALEPGTVAILADSEGRPAEIARSLAQVLTDAGAQVSIAPNTADDAELAISASIIVHLGDQQEGTVGPVAQIAERCMSLRRCGSRIGPRGAALWVICHDALSPVAGSAGSAETGVWGFSRTLANEFPNLDVKRVDVSAGMEGEAIARRLAQLLLSGTTETELAIHPTSIRAVRMMPLAELNDATWTQAHAAPVAPTRAPGLAPLPAPTPPAARLARVAGGGLDRLRWAGVARSPVGADEIEIEVAASGLNFRDVMWSISLLPEDILEDGFAGPGMGLECAGTIVQVGAKVRDLAVGDRVVAFARNAFASHVTVPAAVASKIPSSMPLDAAATVPVAFLTAFYALVTCARLKRREWVLVHGGAGGVGLAALQIARSRGARVIATAGSPEKRELLRILGASHVFDSRSMSFVDDVRRVAPEGVDVVLNSLDGEAMEQSLALLRPFGRFVELGKRDYVGNTHVGLRPFRRNLTYFGVDLDQLLLKDRSAAKTLFRRVMDLFERGILKPLPYRAYEATEAVDAFRLMQKSGHVGKILIHPPSPASLPAAPSLKFRASGSKTHLITGGLGGFGAEAAHWLVDHGARHLVLTSGRGLDAPGALALSAALSRRGAEVRIEACDVSDPRSLGALLDRVAADMPPLAGIIHAAMVLEDKSIANTDSDAMVRVLEPKIEGARHLDALTKDLPLDYFVLFSSATTLIGNPGQGSYVAANSYLESLARRRSFDGLPALAVAWGAIDDVGVLARKDRVLQHLADKVGVKGLAARQALDFMGEALCRVPGTPDEAVIAIAHIDWAKARDYLRVVQSPTFARLASGGTRRDEESEARIDIAALLASKDRETVRREVADAIVASVARILRMPRDEIGPGVALSDIGLDSLMGVELATSLEQTFGLESALATSTVGLTALEIADQLIAGTSQDLSSDEVTERGVVNRHLASDVPSDVLESYAQKIHDAAPSIRSAAE